ncbi:MAG: molybdenum cofactor guanylyltransferase [Deltaproteobacteria bacterium]|nr:MAG: molybdenum cofactor guanylyltransferase [Deltaproteobacteria bacterium]
MNSNKHITGIILAGGKSSRIGSDKGFLLLNEKAFIQHIIEAMQPLVNDIIIVSNNPDYDIFNLKRVTDLMENSGPLAGIYTGLHHSNTENNLVLSCDVPLINTETLKKLTTNIEEHIDVIQLESKGKTMPLIAMYKTHCKNKFFELLQQGEKRLRFAVKQCKVKTITLNTELEKFTVNINTQHHLRDLSGFENLTGLKQQ